MGSYCQNSVATPCPAGTYNGVLAAPDATYCIQVPAGYYTAVAGSTSYSQNPCSPGAYCPAGSTSPTANICPAGTYRTLSGGTDVTDCAQCPTGHYCPPQCV